MIPAWRVAIIDAEPASALWIRTLLKEYPEVEVVDHWTNGTDAMALVRSARPDILFLDIQFPGVDPLDLVRDGQPDPAPAVVIVSALEDHAVRAFEAQAVDYLLKPVSRERMAAALRRAKVALAARQAGLDRILHVMDELRSEQVALRDMLPRARPSRLERLLVKTEGRTVVLPIHEIDWIESAANYVKLHVGPQAFPYRQTLSRLARDLDPATFARIHRSSVVNLERIREIQPWFSGDGIVLLRDGTKLRMSRSYRREVEGRLGSQRSG